MSTSNGQTDLTLAYFGRPEKGLSSWFPGDCHVGLATKQIKFNDKLKWKHMSFPPEMISLSLQNRVSISVLA